MCRTGSECRLSQGSCDTAGNNNRSRPYWHHPRSDGAAAVLGAAYLLGMAAGEQETERGFPAHCSGARDERQGKLKRATLEYRDANTSPNGNRDLGPAMYSGAASESWLHERPYAEIRAFRT